MYPSQVLAHKWDTAVVSPTPSQQQCSDFYASVYKFISPAAAPLVTIVKNYGTPSLATLLGTPVVGYTTNSMHLDM